MQWNWRQIQVVTDWSVSVCTLRIISRWPVTVSACRLHVVYTINTVFTSVWLYYSRQFLKAVIVISYKPMEIMFMCMSLVVWWPVRVSVWVCVCENISPLPPVGHIWDVMLVWRKGNINENCICVTVLYTIIMVHKDTSSSYRSVDCIGLWSCLV